jgi:hypothetical protein
MGYQNPLKDRQTLQTASATERSIDAAAIKLLNPRIQNSSATKVQKFFKLFKDPQILHQTMSLRVSKILSAAQRSTDSRPRLSADMSVHESATKSDEPPTVRTFCVPRNLLMKNGEEDGSTPA